MTLCASYLQNLSNSQIFQDIKALHSGLLLAAVDGLWRQARIALAADHLVAVVPPRDELETKSAATAALRSATNWC